MAPATTMQRTGQVLVALVLVAVLVAGLKLRLLDPMATQAIVAEDPYNHMALTREHVRDGSLDPLNPGGRLYPPGMHALLAATWVFTGADLEQIVKFGPAIFGLIGLVGIAMALLRWEGPAAAIVGVAGFALSAEAIRRTTMMAPTAVDLALMPFALLALVEVTRGRLRWTVPAAILLLFLVFAHPWAITILGLAAGVYALLAFLAPSPRATDRPTARGLGVGLAVLGSAWGLALSGCSGYCGPGFADVWSGGAALTPYAPLLSGAACLVALGLWFAPGWLRRSIERAPGTPRSHWPRRILAVAIFGAFGAATVPAVRNGMPPNVDLPLYFGWPVLILAIIGLAGLPWLRGNGARVGAAVALVTYPFVIYNPFDSPFWSHRTAIYLGLGLVLLGGAAAGALVRAAAQHLGPNTAGLRIPMMLRAPVVLIVLLVPVAVAGADTSEHPPKWYRLYPPCSDGALREIAAKMDADPNALVITGGWQAKLVLAAYATNASRTWFDSNFFHPTNTTERDSLVSWTAWEHRQLFVVLDPQFVKHESDPRVRFLHTSPWNQTGLWCENATPAGRVSLFERTPR